MQEIQVFDHANEIFAALRRGILFTAAASGRVNPMTISWGSLGIEWNRAIFTAYIRENRFTRGLLEANPEFTVSLPVGDEGKEILAYCGSRSGRNTDKVKDLGLTLLPGQAISVPAIAQLPITLECKVLYRCPQALEALPTAFREKFYPRDVPSEAVSSNRDPHIAYYGEIVKAYRID